jgi:hypothetical protein
MTFELHSWINILLCCYVPDYMAGSSSSTAMVPHLDPIDVEDSGSEYDPGWITGDEPLGVPTNLSFFAYQIQIDVKSANVHFNFPQIFAGSGGDAISTVTAPSSEEEEVLFYGPPTLSEHRALLTINRLLTPQLPPDQPHVPHVQPPELTVDAPPAAAMPPIAAQGMFCCMP